MGKFSLLYVANFIIYFLKIKKIKYVWGVCSLLELFLIYKILGGAEHVL